MLKNKTSNNLINKSKMKNKRMRTWGAIVALGLATFSCNKKSDVVPSNSNSYGGQTISNSEMTKLIKKLDNPYSVANMKDPNFGDYEYTPIIIDLLDNSNQGGCCSTTLPIDLITGYSIKNIEDVLKDCKSLSDLRDKLKSNYQIPNQNQLDTFFNQYINL